jgi:hypothetical protein
MLPSKCFSLLPLYVSKEASVMRLIYFNVLLVRVRKGRLLLSVLYKVVQI